MSIKMEIHNCFELGVLQEVARLVLEYSVRHELSCRVETLSACVVLWYLQTPSLL